MRTRERRTHLLPSALLLSPLPDEQNRKQRTQARAIPTETLRSQLLLWLLHHPLQRSEDLLLALDTSSASLYRLLATAEEQGEIEYIQQASRWYYLSNQGLLAAAVQEQAEVKGLARIWEADERGLLQLLPRLHQLTRLQELVNGLARHAPRILAYEDGTLADIEWSWRRDLSHHFLTHVRATSYHADAALCLYRYPSSAQQQNGDKTGVFLTYLLLLDRLTDDEQTIRSRLVSLLQYRESRRAFYATFPAVLVVTETVRRRDRWHRQAQEALRTLRLQIPLQGAITQVDPDEMTIASTWSLPWQRLGEQRSCRIQDLLIPMPLEALPPDLLIPRVEGGQSRIQKRRVLIGKFQQRAEALNMEQETEDLLALLGSVVLRPRYVALLHLLYQAPLLSASEIVDLTADTDLTLPTAIRYLQQLQQWKCIRREDSTSGVRWLLAKRGLYLLAQMNQIDSRHLINPDEEQQRDITLLLTHLQHTAGVYRCLATFGRTARQQANHQLLWWETGSHCEHHYQHRGQWHHFRPDALFCAVIDSSSHLAWLEYDRRTESREALTVKFQTYQTYLATQQWRRELLSRVPTLLIVVPDPARRQVMREVVQETIELGTLRVRMTTMPQLQNVGPYAAIWQQVMPVIGGDRRLTAFEGEKE
jgi:DNA-binding IclR family transcriptional regulator